MGNPDRQPDRISIVMPARNEGRTIDAALQGLVDQDDPRIIEILVADGRSTDDTRERVLDWGKRDARIRLLENPGLTAPTGLNAALEAAIGNVIVRMDGHAEPRPDYVRLAVDELVASGAWCVGGRMLKRGTTSWERAAAAAASSPLGVGDAAHNYAVEPIWAETVFLGTWPRWVFDRVGLFDPELVRNQDDELSYRIRQAGGRIRYDPRIVVEYAPRRSWRALFDQYRQYGMWKVRVFQKHPHAARPRHLVPAAWIASLAVSAALLPTFAGPWLLVADLGAYALVMAAGVVGVQGVSRLQVATAVLALHLGYGLGFWQGMIRFAPRFFSGRLGSTSHLPARGVVGGE